MKQKILLGFIILLALFLRTYNLDTNPPGFYSDEASWAYNAYSIIQTGRDEYARPLPWVFEAFGDFKLPVTVYSIIPSYWLFGVSDWSARLPTAIYGVLSVLAIYFFTKELFNTVIPAKAGIHRQDSNKKVEVKTPNKANQITDVDVHTTMDSGLRRNDSNLALLSAFLLSITPAHIFLSRGIWDIQPALFFLTTGVLFFLKAINHIKSQSTKLKIFPFFLLSSLCFSLSMYAYNSARVVTPLLILLLTIGFSPTLIKYTVGKSKSFPALLTIIIPIIAGVILLYPQLQSLTDPEVTQRARYVSIFNRGDVEAKIFGATSADGSDNAIWFIRLLHNKPVFYASEIAQRYLQHFDLNYLFLTGDTFEIFKVEGIGVLPLATLPFFFVGLIALLKNRPNWWWIVLGWLLIAPIPSALTVFTPSISRAHNMVIPLVIIIAYGILYCLSQTSIKKENTKHQTHQAPNKFQNPNHKQINIGAWNFDFPWNLMRLELSKICISGLLILNLVYWYSQYFILTPAKVAFKWGNGWEQVVDYLNQNQAAHPNIYISNSRGPSYIWLAWYQQLDPQYVWRTRVTDFTPDSNGLNSTSQLGPYRFTKNLKADCIEYTHSIPTICVGFAGEIGGTSEKVISLDHNIVFEILKK